MTEGGAGGLSPCSERAYAGDRIARPRVNAFHKFREYLSTRVDDATYECDVRMRRTNATYECDVRDDSTTHRLERAGGKTNKNWRFTGARTSSTSSLKVILDRFEREYLTDRPIASARISDSRLERASPETSLEWRFDSRYLPRNISDISDIGKFLSSLLWRQELARNWERNGEIAADGATHNGACTCNARARARPTRDVGRRARPRFLDRARSSVARVSVYIYGSLTRP